MPRVLRYAQRQVGWDDAHDVVAEVFAVAWRRWSEVPEPALPWLIGVARRTAANRRRALFRQRRLQSRLELLRRVAEDAIQPVDATDRLDALRRLSALDEADQEVLLLVAWDGLDATAAAAVLGLRPATFRKRLSRARAAVQASAFEDVKTPHPLTVKMP